MLHQWLALQEELLLLEQSSEDEFTQLHSLSARDCQRMGLSLLGLEVTGSRTVAFGRVCVSLGLRDKRPMACPFKPGDEVRLSGNMHGSSSIDDSNSSSGLGIVSKMGHSSVDVILEDFDENNYSLPLRLDIRPSRRTYQKMQQALDALRKSDHPLVSLLFCSDRDELPMPITQGNCSDHPKFYWNSNLNEYQREAIQCSLDAPYLSLIHGPPGTGKTSTLAELVFQLVQRGQKVLVTAPSNTAVDTILVKLADVAKQQKLVKQGYVPLQMLRIGHPARINEATLFYSLDSQISMDEGTEIARDVRRDIELVQKKISKQISGGKSALSSWKLIKQELRTELRSLRKEAKEREKAVVSRIMSRCNVIFSTCVSASSHLLRDMNFDVVVVDEAGQVIEAACWIAILKGNKLVLAGDHRQLPPTVKSTEAERRGLSTTLFERIIMDPNHRYQSVIRQLSIQYRMNDLISSWASREMYQSSISSHSSVASHSLVDLIGDAAVDFPVMLLIDTSNCEMSEDVAPQPTDSKIEISQRLTNYSHRNTAEVDLVFQHVNSLVDAGILPSQIGVITPYNGHLDLLRQRLLPADDEISSNSKQLQGLEVKTIDGFQGGEKECIILSLVRSNSSHEVGFLADHRRINVAVTRAKRHLTVVCDSDTCSSDPLIRSLIQHISEFGEQLNALDYQYMNDAGQTNLTVSNSKSVDIVLSSTSGHPEKNTQLAPQQKARDSSSEDNFNAMQYLKVASKIMKRENVQRDKNIAETLYKSPATILSGKEKGFAEREKTLIVDEVQWRTILLDFQQREGQSSHHQTNFYCIRLLNGELCLVKAKSQQDGDQKKKSKSNPKSKNHGNASETAKSLNNTLDVRHCLAELQFPSSLTSYQRMMVHSLATELGLEHESVGTDGKRHLNVRIMEKLQNMDEDNKVEQVISNSKLLSHVPHTNAFQTFGNFADNIEETELQPAQQTIITHEHISSGSDKPLKQAIAHSKKVDPISDNRSKLRTQNKEKQAESREVEDEDDILEAAIQENQALMAKNRHRLSSTPFKNPDKLNNKMKLHHAIATAQGDRQAQRKVPEGKGENEESNNSRRKKILKKPQPNFGGSRLGSK